MDEKRKNAIKLIITGILIIVMIILLSLKFCGNGTDTAESTSTAVSESIVPAEMNKGSVSSEETGESTEMSSSDNDPESSDYGYDSDTHEEVVLTFRNSKLLKQHYEKHGIEMGFASAEEYEKAAAAVVNNPAALHKTEAEDGDDVYYVEDTNEFVIVSTDGYIRTYFNPDDGLDYFNRQ